MASCVHLLYAICSGRLGCAVAAEDRSIAADMQIPVFVWQFHARPAVERVVCKHQIRSNKMKRHFVSRVAFLALLCQSATAFADPLCTEKTLNGSYVFSAVGFDSTGKTPVAYAGFEYYDGMGHQVYIAKYADATEQSLRGKYTVSPNCRVEVVYENGRTNTFFINPNGKEINYVVTGGAIIASTERWVATQNLVGRRP
jgi:hypothetical protein